MVEIVLNSDDMPICDRCYAEYPGELKECPECGQTLCMECWGDKDSKICKQCEQKKWQ